MEQVQSLINRLCAQSKAQASMAELLATTELLRNELTALTSVEELNVRNAVAVWLPAGYKNQQVKSSSTISNTEDKQYEFTNRHTAVAMEVETENEQQGEPQVSARHNAVKEVPGVPVPPHQVKIVEPVLPSKEEKHEDKFEIKREENRGFYQINLGDEEFETEPLIPARFTNSAAEHPAPEAGTPSGNHRKADETEDAGGEVKKSETGKEVEKNLGQEPAKKNGSRPFPQYPEDASALMKNIFPLSAPPSKPGREINELIADPSVPLYQKLQQKNVELGEVLGEGPKITDLRKALTINDKYQMIHTLFRNDEDMFERSVRTVNNFGSLPEARFWMQRELVLKLGWNEEDEMVQYFYKLVSRRFS